MNNPITSTLYFYLRLIVVWIAAILFFLFLRHFGENLDTVTTPIGTINLGQMLTIAPIIGVFAGLLYGSIELLTEKDFFQRHSYSVILAWKLFFSFIGVKWMMALAVFLASRLNNTTFEFHELIQILRSKGYMVMFVYFVVVSSIISFIRMVNLKFGPGVLWNMFIGRYRNPREEQRVFMFIDLKSSTTIAEELGHLKFSRLIQDCFADLTPIVMKHNVEIYQYVGDEAVLSWPVSTAFIDNQCIHSYFDFMDILASKEDYYKKEYGLLPFFKAGGHLGEVIVAEVGLIKREIAYHGDVLNTAARIQSQCNRLQEPLLISFQLLQHLQADEHIQDKYLGEELLKGKQTKVAIHGIRKV